MKTTIGSEEKIDELLAVLDKDIENIRESLEHLNELRSMVVKRNTTSLSKLLENIQARAESYQNQQSQRQSIRKELAAALGCRPEQITLSRLEEALPQEKTAQLTERKTALRALINKFKKEHLSTVLLLSDCARFNSLLLRSIFELGKTPTAYYNCNGVTKRQNDMALLNLRL